jgi:hypothetical protein
MMLISKGVEIQDETMLSKKQLLQPDEKICVLGELLLWISLKLDMFLLKGLVG